MGFRYMLKKLYWEWNANPIHNFVHWAVFLCVGLVVVINLVSSISTSAIDNAGIGAHAHAVAEALNE